MQEKTTPVYDRNRTPAGSVVISGAGLGLPGAEKSVMDPDNAMRILRGERFVDLIPERFRKKILDKQPPQPVMVAALDATAQLAMAAGLDALREAGIPLVQVYRRAAAGEQSPGRWRLPDALRDETGVIFAGAFPGGDYFADGMERYYTVKNRRDQLQTLQDLRRYTEDAATVREIDRRIGDLRRQLEDEPYHLDRRFLFRILSMGHSQFAAYIGARGPSTQLNAVGVGAAQAVALAEDWIRNGRCRRVIIIGADNVAGDDLPEWVGAGALVVESEDVVRERGMRGVVEVLSTETNNSAVPGPRPDVEHITQVMDNLITIAERRFGLNRDAMALEMVFISHEAYTPGDDSVAAGVTALRRTFGEAAREIVVTNTKHFTGHPMSVGAEDVIAVKILEHGIVPPALDFKEVDEDPGPLTLSRGGRYPVRYALRLAAGFGSQIAFTLTRRIPGAPDRIDSKSRYQRWLDGVSGYDHAETEVEKRALRVKADGPPPRSPAAGNWQYGVGPQVRVMVGEGETAVSHPAPEPTPAPPPSTAVPAKAYPLKNADRAPRRVPVPILRPDLDLCRPTDASLDENSRVMVMGDRGRLSHALAARLEKRGVTVLAIEETPATEILAAQLEKWLDEGPIHGVYWLPALDEAPALAEMDLATWREENRIRTHNLYTTMRRLYDVIDGPGTFLIAATRFGGLHGYGRSGAGAPLGGGVSGFAKAYKRERTDVLVKVVDFPRTGKTAVSADILIAETLVDPGVIEIGYPETEGGERYTISLVEQPPARHKPGLTLNRGSVLVVTGAAGVGAIIADLAAGHAAANSDDLVDMAEAGCGTFYLLDQAPAPDRDDEEIALFRNDKDALKQHLLAEAKAAGGRATPAMLDRQMAAIEGRATALRAIEAVEAAGGTAHYHSVDLRDGEAVTAVIDQIRDAHGKIDALIHAAGLEISQPLNEKDPEQFDLVYGVKADGFFNLLRAAAGMPIAAAVVFSSVAGRFGSSGQTDYSAANDLLCKMSSSLRRRRPKTRGIAIDWTAWAAGVEMLPPEVGIPIVRRELLAGKNDGNGAGEIVVGGDLGALTAEWDHTGGLDVTKANERLAAQTPPLLMVGEITGAGQYSGLVAETTLDPEEQPFLYDYVMDGTPSLPGAMGIETCAQLATALAPGYHVASIENERLRAPFEFHRMAPQTLHLRLKTQPDRKNSLLACAELWSIREPAAPDLASQETLHVTADVRLTPDPLPQPMFEPPEGEWGSGRIFEAAQIYEVYFHGPAYQVLEKVKVEGETAVGLMASDLPPDTDPAGAAFLFAPRLLELCFQTAGVWEIAQKGRMALPQGIRFVTVYRSPAELAGRRLTATVKAGENGAMFDAQVMDEEGNLYVMMTGYQTAALPGEVSL